MANEYIETVNGIIDGTTLASLIGYSNPSSVNVMQKDDLTFLRFNVDKKVLLISNMCNIKYQSFNDCNTLGVVYGKNIIHNGREYKARSITNEEWDNLIVGLVPDDSISNWKGYYTLTQDLDGSGNAIFRGYTSVDAILTKTVGTSSSVYDWRCVLEPMSVNTINIEDSLGDILEFPNIEYTVSGENYDLNIFLDGELIESLDNQVQGTSHVFNNINFDSLKYGKHTIEIVVSDLLGVETSKSITFNKIKEITKPIPITSSLKEFVNHIDNVDKDVDYLRYKLKNNLIGKGVECSDADKMSSLIDKIDGIVVGDNVVAGETIKLLSLTPTISMVSGGKLSWSSNVNGSIKIKIMSVCNNSGSSSSLNIDLLRGDSIVSTKSFTLKSHGSYITIEYDLEGVKLYDVVSIYPKNGLVGANPGGIVISCDKL